MRWVPSGFIQTAKADQCILPSGQNYPKLTSGPGSNAIKTSSFIHSPLQKGNLLPVFATTRIAKRFASRPSSSNHGRPTQAILSSLKQNQKGEPRHSTTSGAPNLQYTAPHGPTFLSKATAKELNTAAASRPVESRPKSEPLDHSATKKQPKTDNAIVASRANLPRKLTVRAHHGPPVSSQSLAIAPKPARKPETSPKKRAAALPIISPARATEPNETQDLKLKNPLPTTAGFAIAEPQTPAQPTSQLAEKAPIFRPKPKRSRRSEDHNRCLALALYYEAGRQSAGAKRGLATVILSRVKSPHYPNTVCGVVYQNAHLRGNCAFSFACDGVIERPEDDSAWAQSRIIALQSLCGNDCSQLKRKPAGPTQSPLPAQSVNLHVKPDHRQTTDHRMKNMGRDGVNAFTLNPKRIF